MVIPLAALHLGFHRVHDLGERHPGIGFLALQVGLPDRLADDELLQAEQMVGNRPGLIELAANQADEVRQPLRLAGRPVGVDRFVGRQLPRMAGFGAGDRILPDLPVVGQSLDVFGRLFLVLAVLEQSASRWSRTRSSPRRWRTSAAGPDAAPWGRPNTGPCAAAR